METTPQNLEEVKKELEAVCAKFGVTLVPVIVHQGNRTMSSIEIISVPTSAPEASTEEAPAAE